MPKPNGSPANLRQEIDAFLQNQTWQDDIYFMRYVEMRREQCRVLQVIYRQLLRLNQVPEQAKPLSAFLADIAMHFHEGNDCSALLEQLESLYAAYRQDELPDTRKAFENRAILLQHSDRIAVFSTDQAAVLSDPAGAGTQADVRTADAGMIIVRC